ncbi:chaperone protein dnaJ 20, chloroplastic-like [Curcuma longa]|uniref:chaperone protein dnaJ 20, chloroplastic-like n=1 Tax=Curcuma longa TaxID=136217 RepID=UPI003D9EBA4E
MATSSLLYGNLMPPSMNARLPAAPRASKNLYQVLALEPENVDGVEAVKRAYRSMARRHHPDVCPLTGKEEATRRFIEIKKAYEVLSNPVLREKYDHQLGLLDLAADGEQEERRVLFPREVWMEQVQELKGRSRRRARRKEMGACEKI